MTTRPAFARIVSVFCLLTGCLMISLALAQNARADDTVLAPKIEGDWWQVAGSPDLGQYTTDRQQPVDFAIWQAADGTWQIWSCIRATSYPGWTRLLYRWEAKQPHRSRLEAHGHRDDLGYQPGRDGRHVAGALCDARPGLNM